MKGRLKIRYRALVAVEPTETGPNRGVLRPYEIAVPIEILFDDSGIIIWRQLPDKTGKIDFNFPSGGECDISGNDLILNEEHLQRQACVLQNLNFKIVPDLVAGSRGAAVHRYNIVAIKARNAGSSVSTLFKGHWEVLENGMGYSFWEGLDSGWTFNTSGMEGIAFGAGIAFGTLKFTDPYGKDWSFTARGGGVGVDPSRFLKVGGKAIKAIIELLKKVPKPSGGGSTESMFNTGCVMKNIAWWDGWDRAMTPNDFTGPAVWAELNVVVIVGGGIQLLFIGVTPKGLFKAFVPIGGAGTGLSLGVGGYGCWVSPNF